MLTQIRFSFTVDREAKTVETKIECNDCGQEVQLRRDGDYYIFLCPTHGECPKPGMRIDRFQALYETASQKVRDKEDLGEPIRHDVYHITTDPGKMN